MILDFLAYGILLTAWILCGALFIKHRGSLIWWLLTSMVILSIFTVGYSLAWAVNRIFIQ